MPISEKTLSYYITQLRRIEQSRAENAEKTIRRIYKALLKDLNGFLGNEYAMYSQDGALTVAILQEKARYAKFLEEVERNINDLTPQAADEILKTVEATYSACYSGIVKAVKESKDTKSVLDYLKGLTVQPEVMKRAIENPISGLTLPDILEKNRKEVVYDIKQQLNISLMNGDRYETTAKKIADRLDISYSKATNIVRTETHRVQESGLMDGAKDIANALDESEFIYTATWRTMKDERVRPQQRRHTKSGWKTSMKGTADHMKMDGVTIKVGDKFKLESNVYAECPGMSGTARNDCRCRCYLEYDLMTEEEFNALENKQVNGFDSETASNSVDKQGESGIIKAEDVNSLEQAKKRDHKIYINDVAIEKVKKLNLSDFSEEQAIAMQDKHKELLRTAMSKNESNEVLLIDNLNFKSEVIVFGEEFAVSPAKDPFAVSVVGNAKKQSLVYLHNHPSTNNFSVGDIDTFICERAIKVMSVVTNQGEVYVLNKLSTYDYNKAREVLKDIYESFTGEEIEDKLFVTKFLKRCGDGGIEYAKSK